MFVFCPNNLDQKCTKECDNCMTCDHLPKTLVCPNYMHEFVLGGVEKVIICKTRESFHYYLTLTTIYGLIPYNDGVYRYVYNDKIMINGSKVYALDRSRIELLFESTTDEIYKYLDDNGYKRKPVVQAKHTE